LTEKADQPPKFGSAATIDDAVFLGRTVERLSILIAEQSKEVFDDNGIVIPVRSCSLMIVISKLGTASAADIARELGRSHQLVMQKIPKLVKLGLIIQYPDEQDARRKLFKVTDLGAKQLMRFEQCRDRLRAAYEGLFAEVGDLKKMVEQTAEALNRKPLDRRVLDMK